MNAEIIAWRDRDGNRYEGGIVSLEDTYHVLVHATNPDDPSDSIYFWTHVYNWFHNEIEWEVYIAVLAANYGYDVA